MFDEDVYQQTGGISGGVCVNCSGNTDGRQCEKCAPFYYPRPDRYQTDPDICEGNISAIWFILLILLSLLELYC